MFNQTPESICPSLSLWSPLRLRVEAGGAFQDQQEGADLIRVHHPGRPGDGALPPREQSHAPLQAAGAAAAAVIAAPCTARPLPPLQGPPTPPGAPSTSQLHTVMDGYW